MWVPHKNILAQNICQVKITVHVMLVKQLLAIHSYTSLFCYRNSQIQSDQCRVLPITIGGKHTDNALLWMLTPRHRACMWMATFKRLLCTCISHGFFIGLSLDFAFCTYDYGKHGLWWNMGSGLVTRVGLGKLSSSKFRLKYLRNPCTIQ